MDQQPPSAPPRRPGRRPEVLDFAVAGFLPGLLFGGHFTLLLLFLNHHLPLRAELLARGWAVFGTVGGLVSLALVTPWLWRRRQRALRWLPWGVTLALALAAFLFGAHASRFAYYLPAEINVRLIKSATALSFAALVAFYTALVHSVVGRRYGLRSRLAYWLLAVVSIYWVTDRRLGFEAKATPVPRPATLGAVAPPSLLVVGLETATLDAILPLAERGRLPFLAEIVEGGSYGHLASLQPHRRTALWASLDTGQLPHRHGVVSPAVHVGWPLGKDSELRMMPWLPALRRWAGIGTEARAVDGRDRRAVSLWTILSRLGVSSGVVGWPGTAPAEEGLSFVLSDRFFTARRVPRLAVPPEIAERGRLFRVRPSELDPAAVADFGGAPSPTITGALAGDLWRASFTSFLLDQQRPPRALFLMMPGLGAVSRRYFGGFNASELEGLDRPPYSVAAQNLESYYAYLDGALAELWNRLEPPRLLVVVSPYGIEPAAGWRRVRAELSEERALRGFTHRAPDGALLLYGEGIRRGGRLSGARLVDLAPTVLYGLGLPIARDFEGTVLRDAFEPQFLDERPITFLPTYGFLQEDGADDEG